MADLGIATNPNKALWEKGDFTKIAETMRQSGEELVATLGIAPGMSLLDLGCGDGTTALPAAQLGAKVTGVDIAAKSNSASTTKVQCFIEVISEMGYRRFSDTAAFGKSRRPRSHPPTVI